MVCFLKLVSPFAWAFFDEVAETIFPKTATPGAKDAKVGEFMKVMVNDCYVEDDQKAFRAGQASINDVCKKMHGHDFMKATPEQRKEVLVSLDKEVKDHQEKRREFNKLQDDLEKKAQANGDTNFKKTNNVCPLFHDDETVNDPWLFHFQRGKTRSNQLSTCSR